MSKLKTFLEFHNKKLLRKINLCFGKIQQEFQRVDQIAIRNHNRVAGTWNCFASNISI